MSMKTVRTLTDRQIELLRKMPGIKHYSRDQINNLADESSFRTMNSLIKRDVLGYDEDQDDYFVRWGLLSERLSERIFPNSTRLTYERELARLNQIAMDFSEGSNASFMRQITVVRALRNMLIKAENLDVQAAK